MTEIIGRGLSFDDVLLVQQVSDVDSRYDSRVNLHTTVAAGAPEINVPLVSANMDTVTEYEMAIALARFGGLGVIHRFMTPEAQAEQVRIVKSEMAIIENDPISINENATVSDALQMLEKRKRGYVLIVSANGKPGDFLGIATNRDFRYGDPGDQITKVMTARDDLFSVPEGTTREQAVAFMKEKRVEKVPMLRADKTLVGIFTLKDDEMLDKYPRASKDTLGRLIVAAAIGVKLTDVNRAHRLKEAGADVLVLDIAHGALHLVEKMIDTLKNHEGIKTPIIAGNISTEETAHYLIESGADGIKVGVGPGLVCDTRDVAGAGMPQITAIMSAREAVTKSHSSIPLMADGGVRKPGDFAKAIGAGADSVMIGSIIAGTTESPGSIVRTNGHQQKMVRGMASEGAHQLRQQLDGDVKERRVPEGNEKFVNVQGDVRDVLFQLEGGLRSGMSYTGAFNIQEMHKKAQFVEVSSAGANEQRRPLE